MWDSLSVARLRRDGQWVRPGDDEHLKVGDEIHAYGDANFFRGGIESLGEEITVSPEIELTASYTHVVVARRDAVGKTLAELDFARRHGLVVAEVRRDGLALPLGPQLRLQRSDVLSVVGPKSAIADLRNILGPVESDVAQTDMTTFAFGIALGAVIGVLAINVGGVPIGLGMAGGLLASGILVGWLNATRPTFGKFPEAARWILMEFGLMIFIVGVGLQAGGQIVETFTKAGPALILAAVFVVTTPVLLGYAFGRKVLRLHPVLLIGALTGAMTSAAAMSLVNTEAKSSIPALGYTGTYAFANVILTVAGTRDHVRVRRVSLWHRVCGNCAYSPARVKIDALNGDKDMQHLTNRAVRNPGKLRLATAVALLIAGIGQAAAEESDPWSFNMNVYAWVTKSEARPVAATTSTSLTTTS